MWLPRVCPPHHAWLVVEDEGLEVGRAWVRLRRPAQGGEYRVAGEKQALPCIWE